MWTRARLLNLSKMKIAVMVRRQEESISGDRFGTINLELAPLVVKVADADWHCFLPCCKLSRSRRSI